VTTSPAISEDHRTVGVERPLWGSSSPQVHLEQAAQGHIPAGFEYLQRRRLHNTSGQCSITLKVKKFFLMFSWDFLRFGLCLLPLVLSLGPTEESGPVQNYRMVGAGRCVSSCQHHRDKAEHQKETYAESTTQYTEAPQVTSSACSLVQPSSEF